ncbi:hypothetical protein OIV83_005275 [Microbotryomycetes sp. JL201]|nr:hypothetical protein OIV83_005275 [Microbotryomycetes sp. JL201]
MLSIGLHVYTGCAAAKAATSGAPATAQDTDPEPSAISASQPVHPPPTKAEIFALAAAAPPRPWTADDPRVSLRPSASSSFYGHDAKTRKRRLDDDDDEPVTLKDFRQAEDPATRLSAFRRLFDSLPLPSVASSSSGSSSETSAASEPSTSTQSDSDERQREADRSLYARELWGQCSTSNVQSHDSTASSNTDKPNTASMTSSTAVAGSAPLSSVAARWTAFEKYADEKERELWRAFVEMDKDGDMRLRKDEVREACRRAGVQATDDATIDEFIRNVSRNGDGAISFEEWRNFFLLLPRQTSMPEMWKYYQTHRSRRPSMSRLTQDGDVVIGGGKSSWDRMAGKASATQAHRDRSSSKGQADAPQMRDRTNLKQLETENDERKFATACRRARNMRLREQEARQHKTATTRAVQAERKAAEKSNAEANASSSKSAPATSTEAQAPGSSINLKEDDAGLSLDDEEEEDEPEPTAGMFSGAGKFLLAGGLAGAVSRTATAPFDRLKVYLITQGKEPIEQPEVTGKDLAKKVKRRKNAGSLPAAVRAVLKQGGGIKGFWTGNGLNVIKIFPESAIKFLSYESAKRVFAQYWDHVPDQTMISNSSRFVAGGIGGVVSQFVIYPIESLKTRVMSSTGGALRGNALILKTAADMWAKGGIPFFFRGLPAGLVGVFPYSAIDMSTFEGIKLAYTKWSGTEPGVVGSLAFGALSGGIGATSVYPLNVIRTRLQAQGTPAHPQVYTGVRDAAHRCYVNDGWRGFYKGLTPTLVKVVPAVAISYAVYDTSKKVLFGRDESNCHALQNHQDDDSDES